MKYELPAGVTMNFTQRCVHCGELVQYEGGKRLEHPCPESDAVVVEGCTALMDEHDETGQCQAEIEEI